VNLHKDEAKADEKGLYQATYSAVVRITVTSSGTSREDLGFGHARGFRFASVAERTAKEIAIKDGIKRAVRQFGERFINASLERKRETEAEERAKAAKARSIPIPRPASLRDLGAKLAEDELMEQLSREQAELEAREREEEGAELREYLEMELEALEEAAGEEGEQFEWKYDPALDAYLADAGQSGFGHP